MKNLAVSIICWFALVQTMSAPTNLIPQTTVAEERAALELLQHRSHVSLAFKTVAAQRMLAEANYLANQLKWVESRPIQMGDVKELRVFNLWYGRVEIGSLPQDLTKEQTARILAAKIKNGDFKFAPAGTLVTTNFFFSFNGGRLWYLARQSKDGYEYQPPPERRVIINDAEAYQLATQYLAVVSVDLTALETKLKSKVWRYTRREGTNEVPAPFFFVQWGEGSFPPVKVAIDGTTKELLSISIPGASFSKRPLLIITNALELNNISDPPIKRLQQPSKLQTNLLSVSTHPPPRPPPFQMKIK